MMKRTKLNLFNILQTIRNKRISNLEEKTIEYNIKKTVKQYKNTIKMLEEYDKGKIERPKELARPSSVRRYLQQL